MYSLRLWLGGVSQLLVLAVRMILVTEPPKVRNLFLERLFAPVHQFLDGIALSHGLEVSVPGQIGRFRDQWLGKNLVQRYDSG